MGSIDRSADANPLGRLLGDICSGVAQAALDSVKAYADAAPKVATAVIQQGSKSAPEAAKQAIRALAESMRRSALVWAERAGRSKVVRIVRRGVKRAAMRARRKRGERSRSSSSDDPDPAGAGSLGFCGDVGAEELHELPGRLRELRENVGLSTGELAARAGCPVQLVDYCEFDSDVFERLGRELSLELDRLAVEQSEVSR